MRMALLFLFFFKKTRLLGNSISGELILLLSMDSGISTFQSKKKKK